MRQRHPDQSEELGLVGVAPMVFCESRFHRSGEEVAQRAQRCVAGVADDDVVEHFDLQELPGPDEVAGDPDVGFRWRRVAGRMVMHEYDGSGAGHDGPPEHLARMTEQEFDAVQRLLIRSKRMPRNRRVFALTGLIRCGGCGSAVTAEEKHQLICSLSTITCLTSSSEAVTA